MILIDGFQYRYMRIGVNRIYKAGSGTSAYCMDKPIPGLFPYSQVAGIGTERYVKREGD